MKKILVIAIMSLLLVSCGAKNDGNTKGNDNEKKVEVKVEKKYGDLTEYIKSDITDTESKSLLKILEDRKARQAEIKSMIEKATKETKDDVYDSIVEKRKVCANRILPYVDKLKADSFKKYCIKINYQIKNKLDELK